MTEEFVETVLGPVRARELGIVMPHEHFPSSRGVSEALEPPAGYAERLERWEREVVREAQSFGVRTLVEVTPIGCMRLVPMMQRVSRDTGVHVVASTGFYLEGRRPEWVKKMDADALAAVFVRELTESMSGTDAKAWMIKVAAVEKERWCEEDAKVFRAAALASRRTGAAVTTHSCGAVRFHFDTLVEAGADPSRITIGHADLVSDPAEYLHVARAGGRLLFTCWGIEHFVPQDLLARRVADVVQAGFPQAVLLSIDYALIVSDNRMDLITMEYECPRRTPGFLFRWALPKLREAGITDDLIRRFTVDNPREMLVRPAKAPPPRGRKIPAAHAALRSGLTVKPFADDAEDDVIHVVNAYTAGWPYSRPIDAELLAHWKTLGESWQPERMLIAYRDGVPRALVHGERTETQFDVHLLAMVPGAVEEAAWLLGRAEAEARSAGSAGLFGPRWRAGRFYGGYVLGLEPYHPHWAVDGTEAWVRAGFRISHPAVLLVASLAKDVPPDALRRHYEIVEADAPEEFAARTFRLAAAFKGKEVATCTARLYPKLSCPAGGAVAQIGWVGTDEAHRGRGLARALVRTSLARLKQWGAAEALVATGLDNFPALRAYENAGFERRHAICEWSKDLSDTHG